ncbi:MAG: flagellar biosynthetic protein FliR [Acidimicrobiaceae bacterium]|nr:flagellar biosynthetic protein FliR [Acidimicrobiaceae bacterium]
MSLQLTSLVAFLLALARAGGFVFLAMPFSSKMIPRVVQVGVAVALAFGTLHVAMSYPVPIDSSIAFVGQILVQALSGAILGFVVTVFVDIGMAAGSLLGLFGGFSPPPSMDPLSLNQAPALGTFYDLLAITLLFASGGDRLVVAGLIRSMGTEMLSQPSLGLQVIVKSVSIFFGAAFQIAAPVLAVMFLSQVVLGIVVKVAPQLNAMQFMFPLQILLSLTLVLLTLTLVPGILTAGLHYAFIAERDLVGG